MNIRTIIFFGIILLSRQTFAQHNYIRNQIERNIRKDIEKKQAEKHQDEKQKGEDAVDEIFDQMDDGDESFREQLKPFPTIRFKAAIEELNGDREKMEIQYSFKNYDCAVFMRDLENKYDFSRMIIHYKTGKAITLNERNGEKTGMEMDMKMMNSMVQRQKDTKPSTIKTDKPECSLQSTSDVKKVNGYKCQKYTCDAKDYYTEFWFTQDPIAHFPSKDIYLAQSRAIYSNSYLGYYNPRETGILIQVYIRQKNKKRSETLITFSDFDNRVSDDAFSTKGYNIQKMPSLRDMWNQYKDED